MTNITHAYIIPPSRLMRCSICAHYVGEHHDKGCCIQGCDCGNGASDMAADMRDGDLRGYVSNNNKIAILIGNSYHIFNIPNAEDLAHFILSVVDIAKMTAIPEDKNDKTNQT